MLTVTTLGSQSWLKITQNQQFSGSSISTSTCRQIWESNAWLHAARSATKKHLSINNRRTHIWEKQLFQCRHPITPKGLYHCEHVTPLRKPSCLHIQWLRAPCYKTSQKKGMPRRAFMLHTATRVLSLLWAHRGPLGNINIRWKFQSKHTLLPTLCAELHHYRCNWSCFQTETRMNTL